MGRGAAWVASYLPVVVLSRRRLEEVEQEAFDQGRSYERAVHEDLLSRRDRIGALPAQEARR